MFEKGVYPLDQFNLTGAQQCSVACAVERVTGYQHIKPVMVDHEVYRTLPSNYVEQRIDECVFGLTEDVGYPNFAVFGE